ncbi:MAG: hypothetical protein HKN43_10760 [Rhodothermales bacterium]|nr:hypothetical protein [Rhodothermales bacterium]
MNNQSWTLANHVFRTEDGASLVEATIALATLLVVVSTLMLTALPVFFSTTGRPTALDLARFHAERFAGGLKPCSGEDYHLSSRGFITYECVSGGTRLDVWNGPPNIGASIVTLSVPVVAIEELP